VWVGSQVLERAQPLTATAVDLPCDKIVTHNHLIGSGTGRRLEIALIRRGQTIAWNHRFGGSWILAR
jgi:hypothetical protein